MKCPQAALHSLLPGLKCPGCLHKIWDEGSKWSLRQSTAFPERRGCKPSPDFLGDEMCPHWVGPVNRCHGCTAPPRWSQNRTECLSLGVSLTQSPGSRYKGGESGRGSKTVDPGSSPGSVSGKLM